MVRYEDIVAKDARPVMERACAALGVEFDEKVLDPYEGDRLGRLKLTFDGLARRDRFVFARCLEARVPVAVAMSGGYAPDILRRSAKVLSLTREIFEAGKPVAFICHAGWVPISAGIVRGKRGTSVGAIRDDLVNAGMIWEDSSVVVDGNLISSRTPADLPQFMKALIRALEG